MTAQNNKSANTAPVKTFRDGAISVRVWKNTSSINGRDAFKVSNLFISANTWIIQQQYSIPAQPETVADGSGQ